MAEPKRGMGRGLAAILPSPARAARSCASCRSPRSSRTPTSRASTSRRARSRRWRVRSRRRGAAAPDRPPDRRGRRPLRDRRRRAPLARGAGGRARAGPGRDPELARGRAPPGRADREHGPRGPEPGRGGSRLRRPGRRPRDLEGGAGSPRRAQQGGDLEPGPPARPARRRPVAPREGRADRGPRPSDPPGRRPGCAAASGSRRRPRAGRSASSRRRTRSGDATAKRKPSKGGRISAEEKAAMADAEDALGEASAPMCGSGRRARASGPRSTSDDLDELLALARRLEVGGLDSPVVCGRLAQLVRARL